MNIKIKSYAPQNPPLGKPHHIEKWYDRHSKNWYVQVCDKNGYEIEFQTCYRKQETEFIEKMLKEAYHL